MGLVNEQDFARVVQDVVCLPTCLSFSPCWAKDTAEFEGHGIIFNGPGTQAGLVQRDWNQYHLV